MKNNKFIICFILTFFLVSCSISNPLKKELKVTNKDCPQSLILYEARSLNLGNANTQKISKLIGRVIHGKILI